jgi:hypothetical protein
MTTSPVRRRRQTCPVRGETNWASRERSLAAAWRCAEPARNLFGDEANLTPKTPAYFVLNLHTSYQLTPNLQLFGLLQNAFNTTFYTFGTFSPTSSVFIAQARAANPRSYSPCAPIAGTVGVRVTFDFIFRGLPPMRLTDANDYHYRSGLPRRQ